MIGDRSEGINNFRKEVKLDNEDKFTKVHNPKESVYLNVKDNKNGRYDTKGRIMNLERDNNEGKVILKVLGNIKIFRVLKTGKLIC